MDLGPVDQRQGPAVTTHPTIIAFLKTLRETQYLSPDRLRAYQRRQMARLLAHARAETEFYADRLTPIFRADGSIDWDRWEEIPIVTRREAEVHKSGLAARSVPVEAGATTISRSSGSTAEPFECLRSEIHLLASACASERCYEWHDLDPSRLTALIWWPMTESAAGAEDRFNDWRLGHPESVATSLSILTPVSEQIDWLARTGAGYLSTYPTNMREIARAARQRGMELRFDALLTGAEMMSEATAEEIREYFGKQPVDRYASTETGLMAVSCPGGSGYHFQSDIASLELVREDGHPAKIGEPGRVVATPFYAFAMPLIRYDTGDWAVAGVANCSCGRTLPFVERIYGRSRNMFRFSDGKVVWPILESELVQKFVPHRQFQVIQTAPDEIEYRYVPIDPALPIDPAGLTAYARTALNPNVTVTPVAVDEIIRPPNGKFEDYISLI
jgi:phenylacetate-CoA ligase